MKKYYYYQVNFLLTSWCMTQHLFQAKIHYFKYFICFHFTNIIFNFISKKLFFSKVTQLLPFKQVFLYQLFTFYQNHFNAIILNSFKLENITQ